MPNRRANSRKRDTSRDPGGFIALPWSVTDCPAYGRLSHPARSLLVEFARQVGNANNGRLLASGAYLAKRGWNSADVITRAKRELLNAGFIFETVMGHRPNRASWYAVTWRTLDKLAGYDVGVEKAFERGAYQKGISPKNTFLTPPHGVGKPAIAPPHGVGKSPPAPSHSAIRPIIDRLATPSHGNHLEMPSVGVAFDPAASAPLAVVIDVAVAADAAESQQSDDTEGEYVRQRDNDIPAENWQDGEPCKPPLTKKSVKPKIIKVVGKVLAERSNLH